MSSTLFKRQVRRIDGSTLTTSLQNLGAVVTIVGYKVCIVNGSTTDVQITDGTSSDAYYLPAGSAIGEGEGITGYGQLSYQQFIAPNNTQYQIKIPSGSAGTGSVVITTLGK